MKPLDRVNRIQSAEPTGATILDLRFDIALIEYDEGGQGWWPLNALRKVEDLAQWDNFKKAMLGSHEVNQSLVAAMALAPLAVLALPTALINLAAGGSIADFRAAWLAIRRTGAVPAELIQQITGVAVECQLPPEVVKVLGGEIAN
jgi:hypothetical protein